MERKQALLPICSGTLGLCCAALQLVAIATPYWAIFWSNDPLGTGVKETGDQGPVEKGNYGLWTICISISQGIEWPYRRCDKDVEIHFNPGMLRFVAGACAAGNLALLLVFLSPIPAQLLFVLKNKGILPITYQAITMTKIVTSCMGGAAAVAAAIIVNFQNRNDFFEESKGWSFGIQIVVIVLEVFLIICSSAEHMVGRQYPRGKLTKCRQAKSEKALTNLGFNEKTPQIESKPVTKTPPPSPVSETLLYHIKTDREINGRPVTVASSLVQKENENKSRNKIKDLSEETETRPNKKIKEKPVKEDSENSNGMQFHNPEFQASCESIESSPEYKRNDKVKTYYYGNSMDDSIGNSYAPRFSLSNSNLSTLTARSTDV